LKKFEYKIISFKKKGMNALLDLNELETTLTGLGLDGWEVVENFDHLEKGYLPMKCYLLKREIPKEEI